jgi:hypothetical protein
LEKFLDVTTDEEMKDCFRKFRAATSNERLKVFRCVVCARELEGEKGGLSELLEKSAVRDLLKPLHSHSAHALWHGALVLGEDINGWKAWICWECSSALEKEKVPRYALANELWIGTIPSELAILTIPEQLLVARYYPRCYVFKLFPRNGGHLKVDQLQRGMKGNVSVYELNTQDVVEMLQGQKMPNAVTTLASVLAITILGSVSLPKDWLKTTFRIHRKVVYEALVWLKMNNSLYADIKIERERLQMLPEDGVPDEVLSLIRQEVDESVADKENDGYVDVGTGGNEGSSNRVGFLQNFLKLTNVKVMFRCRRCNSFAIPWSRRCRCQSVVVE